MPDPGLVQQQARVGLPQPLRHWAVKAWPRVRPVTLVTMERDHPQRHFDTLPWRESELHCVLTSSPSVEMTGIQESICIWSLTFNYNKKKLYSSRYFNVKRAHIKTQNEARKWCLTVDLLTQQWLMLSSQISCKYQAALHSWHKLDWAKHYNDCLSQSLLSIHLCAGGTESHGEFEIKAILLKNKNNIKIMLRRKQFNFVVDIDK